MPLDGCHRPYKNTVVVLLTKITDISINQSQSRLSDSPVNGMWVLDLWRDP